MSDAIASVGTTFGRWDSGLSAWANLSEVNSISGPGMTRELIDVTSLDSTGGYREYLGGFRDGGQVQLVMNFTRANYIKLLADYESDDLGTYRIHFPDDEDTTIVFMGFVMEIPISIAAGEKVTVNCNFKVSGEPVLSSGESSGI